MLLFAIATSIPVLLIALAVQFGGVWPVLAVAYITILISCLDSLIAREARNADPEAEFPAATTLLLGLGMTHFGLLALSVWAIAGPSGLTGLNRGLIFVAASMVFGQISHPVAHELIHRSGRKLRLLGRLVYSSLLIGHHASAHLLVHHVHVGSAQDPNTARRGEGFYAFMLRAARGSFMVGLAAETRRMQATGRSWLRHPYTLYTAVALLALAGAHVLAGWVGVLAFIGMALYAQFQVYMSDYVQHYGLHRAILADGRPEPVGPQHSWNAPHLLSSAMMVNAPRHSDHHVTPTRPFPALQLDADAMPYLPRSLPVMAAIALLPPIWRQVMNPLCDQWAPDRAADTPVRARDIPRAVLDKAKSGGLIPSHLPNSGHATDRHPHSPALPGKPALGAKPDDGGRV